MEFLHFLEGLRLPFLDHFFQLCTYLGQDIPILVVICVLYWCVNKRLAYQIGLSFFTAGLLLQNLKITFRIDRPWVLDPAFHPVESAVPAATGYSFPSGHSQSAASLFGTLALHVKGTWAKILCVLAIALVGFSRMYLGVHTPKDVLTAIAIGLITTFFIHLLMSRLSDTKEQNAKVGILLGLCSLATAGYAFFLLRSDTIPEVYAADCCKAAGAGLGFAVGWFVERTYIRFTTKAPKSCQVIKCALGLLVTLFLKVGLKKILGAGIPAEIVQYFVIILWIIALYPALFQKTGWFQEK